MVFLLKKSRILLPYLTPSLCPSPQSGNLCVDADSNIFLASITASLLYLPLLLSFRFPFQPSRSALCLSTLPLPHSLAPFLSFSPCHHIRPPPTLSPHPPPLFFFFSLVYFHIPSLPALPSRPSLLPTASQMDRKGVGPSMPANQSDPPQGAASLHYGYIRMSVVVKRTVRLKLCGG